MAFLHRKFLPKPENISDHESCTPPPLPLFRPRLSLPPPPPPPPPPRPSLNQSFPPLLSIMFGGLAVTLFFTCYLTCAKRYRRRRTNYANTDHETRQDFVNEDLGPVTLNPIWLINTIGLDESQIESIQVFKYKQDEKLIEGTDCSVCLSEFADDESLRLLPKCSHAFHVPCIDTWLRSHKNCPLCRSPIFKDTNDQIEHARTQSNLIESSTSDETETRVNDSETVDDHDHHVVEVENSEEIVKTNLGDHHQVQGEEFVAMRRSFSNSQIISWKKQITLLEKRVSPTESSMPKGEHKLKGTSSSNIHLCGKVTKSASFARSLRKASSFTSTCSPYNQTY